MINKYNYYVDYNHASDASSILWTHEDIRIEDWINLAVYISN